MANDGPPPDVLASIITQVSQNGQPARAPYNPQQKRRPAKNGQAVAKTKSKAVREQQATTDAAEQATLPETIPLPSTSKGNGESVQDQNDSRQSDHAGGSLNAPPPDFDEANTTQSSTLKPSSFSNSSAVAGPAQLPSSGEKTAHASASTRRKKKKRTGFMAFLAALGCVSNSAHDSDDERQQTREMSEKSGPDSGPLRQTSKKRKQQLSQQSGEKTTPTLRLPPNAYDANDIAMSRSDSGHGSRLGTPVSKEETGNVMSAAVVNPGADPLHITPHGTPRKRRSRVSNKGEGEEDDRSSASGSEAGEVSAQEEEEDDFIDEQDEEDRIIQAGGMGIPIGEDGLPHPLLEEVSEADRGRKCLVLDLDETLVHSSFKFINNADFIVPVEIENQVHNVYVIKRPGVDEFMRRMGELYEVVVFTASLSKYADPVLDHLDIHRVVRHRLFRESCYNHKGNYVKDLSQIGRPIADSIIIDNSPASYIFHPKNAVPVSSWFNDPHDTELTDMVGVLADLATVDDVRSVLDCFLYDQ